MGGMLSLHRAPGLDPVGAGDPHPSPAVGQVPGQAVSPPIPPCNCFPRCCPAVPQLCAAAPSPCSPARQRWPRAAAPAHAWRDAHGLPRRRPGVAPAQPSSPGPKPAPGTKAVARERCTPSRAQLLPREPPHGDTRRGTRGFIYVQSQPAQRTQHSGRLALEAALVPPHLSAVQGGDTRSRSWRCPDGASRGRVAPGALALGSGRLVRVSAGAVAGAEPPKERAGPWRGPGGEQRVGERVTGQGRGPGPG